MMAGQSLPVGGESEHLESLSEEEFLALKSEIEALLEGERSEEAEENLIALAERFESGYSYSPEQADKDRVWLLFSLGRASEMQGRLRGLA